MTRPDLRAAALAAQAHARAVRAECNRGRATYDEWLVAWKAAHDAITALVRARFESDRVTAPPRRR